MIARGFMIFLVRLLTGVRVRWRETAIPGAQCVYFANHTSNLDGVVLWAALPPAVRNKTRPVAAADYWTKSALRQYLAGKVFNAVLIERKNVTVKNNPLKPMLAALEEGSSLIIFPEGGRNASGELGEFKSGIYHLASNRPDVAFVPAWIDNVNRVLPKGEVLPVPMLGGVTVGGPIKLGEGEARESFILRARDALLALKS